MVDDDPFILESFSAWLETRCGAEISAFSSAEEAMAALTPDGFDVCILDYRLDGANGLTLGAMLREINPAAHLILLSGNLPPEVESLAFEHGFGQVLVKPVSPERLLDAIRQ
jgi:two-component system C4-dicarboxylate transport response regulator DctD